MIILCLEKKFGSYLLLPNIQVNPYNHPPLHILTFIVQTKTIHWKIYCAIQTEIIKYWETVEQAYSLHITISSNFIANI